MKNLTELTKQDIEEGKFPLLMLLNDSVYYPACGIDGQPVKHTNLTHGEWRITSYIYADYSIDESYLALHLNEFRHYHIFATRDLKQSELLRSGADYMRFCPVFTELEREEYIRNSNEAKPFAKWIVYERNEGENDTIGPERFSMIYICGEGVATYAALYRVNNIAPKVLAIIRPGGAFGGNYTSFYAANGPLHQVIEGGKKKPELVYVGADEWIPYNDFFE